MLTMNKETDNMHNNIILLYYICNTNLIKKSMTVGLPILFGFLQH